LRRQPRCAPTRRTKYSRWWACVAVRNSIPQWVPFYAATQIFNYFNADYPDYTYKEAALNPTNQRDRALGWEADIVAYFRDNPGLTEISGERDSVTGHSLYFAHPIVAQAGCLECHGSVAAAPPKMVSQYGSSNGFGWKLNEIVGAQIVSVPMSVPLQKADTAFRTWLSSVAGLALLTLVAVGAGLTFFVSRPLRRVTAAADEIGRGNAGAAPLTVRGGDEIARLSRALNRVLVRFDARR
jgi:protein-histidine pros-kinase